MIANYHTHTVRCNHASGTEREYVERAIAGGLKILGFSDHTPYPFPDGYRSGIRMRLHEMDNYVNTVLDLKKEYQSDIEIHLGVEVEYYPRFFGDFLDFMKDYPVEYFLHAQHYTGDELEGVYSGKATEDPAILKKYCDQVIEAINTGRFTYLAHPDLINFVGDAALYEQQLRRVCREAKQHSLPMEINFLGLYEGRHYPNEQLWKIVGEEGNQVIFGADAHQKEAVWRPEVEKKALELVERYGLKLVETVELVKPF